MSYISGVENIEIIKVFLNVGEQMSRTRLADRYFYSNIEQPEPFSNQQLKQLRRSSLFRLFCDNTPGLQALQRDVFSVISDR